MTLRTRLAAVLLWLSVGMPAALAQQTPLPPPSPAVETDSIKKYQDPPGAPKPARHWYQSKLLRATAIPAVLIGYGVSTINDHGFYSSYDARADLQRHFPNFHTRVDDILIFAPYGELAAVALAGIESRDDRINTLLVIVKAEAIMGVTVFGLKSLTRVQRPDGDGFDSFPSGHTAQAFLAASIVHTEFRDQSQWYGIGAYTIATSVAALRMLNNRHWQSDVFAGAGFGILSAHLAYLSHRHRWGRKPHERTANVNLVPGWSPRGGAGLTFTWQPR